MSALVLPQPVNESALAWVFRRVRDASDANHENYAAKGLRVARAREPLMLKALEALTTLAENLADQRSGRIRRDASTPYSLRVEPQEAQYLRAAFVTADKGNPAGPMGYVYAAVAEWACVITR